MNLEERTIPLPVTGCRIWLGSTSAGYGTFRRGGKVVYVHREVLAAKEPEPFEGAHALHSCDVKCCCEETHLRWGTPKDNAADTANRRPIKRNPPRGEAVNTSRLTEDDVRFIRASVLPNRSIDQMFGLSAGRTWRIRAGLSWSHVE